MVLLADEPTGNLDSAAGAEVLRILRAMTEGGERAVVMVTHDERAAAIGDRKVLLRDGRVEP
jgi:putative ABC transport system ATP-binding protein